MRKIIIGCMVAILGMYAAVYASPPFDFSGSNFGIYCWNPTFQRYDTCTIGEGLAVSQGDSSFTGATLLVQGVPMGSVLGLSSWKADTDETLSEVIDYLGFLDGSVNSANTQAAAAVSIGSGVVSLITGVNTNMIVLSGYMSSMSGSIASGQASINNIVTNMTGMNTRINACLTGSALSGLLTASALTPYLLIPMGTSGQYILGNGTLGTFPTNISAFNNNVGYTTGLNFLTGGSLSGYATVAYVNSGLALKQNVFTIYQTGVTRPLTTAFRISTTGSVLAIYSVRTNLSVGLATPQEAWVVLQTASDSGFTTNVQELARLENGISGIITTNNSSAPLMGVVLPNQWVRLLTVQNLGTNSTFAYKSGQETFIG